MRKRPGQTDGQKNRNQYPLGTGIIIPVDVSPTCSCYTNVENISDTIASSASVRFVVVVSILSSVLTSSHVVGDRVISVRLCAGTIFSGKQSSCLLCPSGIGKSKIIGAFRGKYLTSQVEALMKVVKPLEVTPYPVKTDTTVVAAS